MGRGHDPDEGSAATRPDPVLLRRGSLVVTRPRLLQSGSVAVLLVLGAVLPYVRLSYINSASEPVTGHPGSSVRHTCSAGSTRPICPATTRACARRTTSR